MALGRSCRCSSARRCCGCGSSGWDRRRWSAPPARPPAGSIGAPRDAYRATRGRGEEGGARGEERRQRRGRGSVVVRAQGVAIIRRHAGGEGRSDREKGLTERSVGPLGAASLREGKNGGTAHLGLRGGRAGGRKRWY